MARLAPVHCCRRTVKSYHIEETWSPRRKSVLLARSGETGERISQSRAAKGERGIWQRRYWEHTIRDETDFNRHVDYIGINPVKHRLVARVRDWPYSSFHRMVKLGVYPEDWLGDVSHDGGFFGERQ